MLSFAGILHCSILLVISLIFYVQKESQIHFNTISNVEKFVANFHEGKWDAVLADLDSLDVSQNCLIDLYEHVVFELVESREIGVARSILRMSRPLMLLKERNPDRYLKIEYLLTKNDVSNELLYGDQQHSKLEKRVRLANEILKETQIAPNNRLINLLKYSINYQKDQGIIPAEEREYDLFRGISSSISSKSFQDAVPLKNYKTIQIGINTTVECTAFSHDGELLAIGTGDGFLEIWNPFSATYRSDLLYQKNEQFMNLPSSIISVSFSKSSKYLAAGSKDGELCVWSVLDGTPVKTLAKVHEKGITCIAWHDDETHLVTGSYDHLGRVHGLNVTKELREFRGHSSFINGISFLHEFTRVVTVSSDGSAKIWNYKTCVCLHTLTPSPSADRNLSTVSLTAVLPMANRPDNLLIFSYDRFIFELNNRGEFLMKIQFPHHQNNSGQLASSIDTETGTNTNTNTTSSNSTISKGEHEDRFLCGGISNRGEYIYAVGDDSFLYSFNSHDKCDPIGSIRVCNKEIIGMSVHPFANIFVLYDVDGKLYFFHG